MEKEMICLMCGKKCIVPSLRRKFCDDCQGKARRESARKARKRRNERITIRVSADTEEMRNLCLNCTKKGCSGECEELARIAKGVAHDD